MQQKSEPTPGTGSLGQLHDAGVAVMRPRPPLKRQRPWASIVAVAGTVLVALAATLVLMTTRKEAPAPKQIARIASADPVASTGPPKGPDADLALDQARAEATRWNADAVLASMEVGPFVAGKLLPEGTLRAEFGRPAGAHVGPGAGLHKEVLVVSVSAGSVTSSAKNLPGRVGLADPNCIVQDVWRKALPDETKTVGQSAQSAAAATGTVDPADRLTLRYEFSRRDGRAVFRVMKEGSSTTLRTLDGSNCSFLLR